MSTRRASQVRGQYDQQFDLDGTTFGLFMVNWALPLLLGEQPAEQLVEYAYDWESALIYNLEVPPGSRDPRRPALPRLLRLSC